MKPLWKYTVGLVIELVIKVLQSFVSKSDNVINGTGSNNRKDDL